MDLKGKIVQTPVRPGRGFRKGISRVKSVRRLVGALSCGGGGGGIKGRGTLEKLGGGNERKRQSLFSQRGSLLIRQFLGLRPRAKKLEKKVALWRVVKEPYLSDPSRMGSQQLSPR